MENMETKVERINREQMNMEIIREAGSILKRGGLVAFPTETVYGLGANALDEKPQQRLMRPREDRLIIL